MKRIFVVDWILIPLSILATYTGIELHIAGHSNNHEIWHDWALFHMIVSLPFLIVVLFHIITHWNWYKGIISKGIGKKSKTTLCLSVIFAFIVITGVILLYAKGVNSSIGLWHYKIGILISIISIGHIIKRIPILRKSLKAKI